MPTEPSVICSLPFELGPMPERFLEGVAVMPANRHLSTDATNSPEDASVVPPVAVILDFEGVVASVGGPTQWGDGVGVGDPEDGLSVSPTMCVEVAKLTRSRQVGCYWLTDGIVPASYDQTLLPGAGWPVLSDPAAGPDQAREWAGDLWGALPWWKWWALDHWLTEHPEVRRLAWIDDDLDGRRAGPSTGTSPSKRAWTIETALRSGAGVDALLLAPARHEGLRPLDVRIVADWILGIR